MYFDQSQMAQKLKNLNCDQILNLKLWQNSKTQIAKKIQ